MNNRLFTYLLTYYTYTTQIKKRNWKHWWLRELRTNNWNL